ncbi:alpha/beta hydrolase [Cronobacter condimenti]|uniref:alpha/beta hydrolase n=1 Tax=Cronobacter condimenti TaxID=1163710 RepID=UPI00100EB41F|nr:alpha/beta hydrolase [Cronobacter condimenti]
MKHDPHAREALLARMREAVAHAHDLSVWPQGEAPGAQTSHTVFTLEAHHTGASELDRSVTGVRAPRITVYAPQTPNGVGILVTPGGSYRRVVLDKEGSALAPAFNDRGYTLFVMTYRLPDDDHAEGADAPLADLQRAMRLIRAQAARWQLDPQKLGVLGFSAGAHAAASLGTRWNDAVYVPLDETDACSARPAFMGLVYPVMTMEAPDAHPGSRQALIGTMPDEAAIRRYSPETAVNDRTPPAFLLHAVDDPAVKVENSLRMFNALHAHGVPVEMHLFEKGRHGFGIRDALDLPAHIWPELLMNWLEDKLA